MKHVERFTKILSFTAHLLMVVFLLCMFAIPATSFGIIHLKNETQVLGTQDIRIKVNLQDVRDGKYIYDRDKGELIENPNYYPFRDMRPDYYYTQPESLETEAEAADTEDTETESTEVIDRIEVELE